MNLHYCPAEAGDVPDLVELMARQYARPHRAAYFRWQYFEAHHPTVCMTAWDGTKLVGMFGLQNRSLVDGTRVGHCIDLLVHPEHRGEGVFAELGRRAQEHFHGLDALTVLPNARGMRSCVRVLGMRSLAKIDDMVLSLTAAPTASGPEAMKTTSEPSLRFATGSAYRAWRFDRSPQYKYKTLGKGVTKSYSDPVTREECGDIVDWTVTTTLEDARETSSELLALGHATLSTWALPHSGLHDDLCALGYAHRARERYFCVRVFSESSEHLYDIRKWQLVPADAEIY